MASCGPFAGARCPDACHGNQNLTAGGQADEVARQQGHRDRPRPGFYLDRRRSTLGRNRRVARARPVAPAFHRGRGRRPRRRNGRLRQAATGKKVLTKSLASVHMIGDERSDGRTSHWQVPKRSST
jgi:hypothetical protein